MDGPCGDDDERFVWGRLRQWSVRGCRRRTLQRARMRGEFRRWQRMGAQNCSEHERVAQGQLCAGDVHCYRQERSFVDVNEWNRLALAALRHTQFAGAVVVREWKRLDCGCRWDIASIRSALDLTNSDGSSTGADDFWPGRA